MFNNMTHKNNHRGLPDKSKTQTPAEEYQEYMLPLVSHTFALTIPQLPYPLRTVVANAYLLARTADTLEDRPEWSVERKQHYVKAFLEVVMSQRSPEDFLAEVIPLLPEQMPLHERDLIQHLPLVLTLTHSFNDTQRQAIERCIRIMTYGMAGFQHKVSIQGLKTMSDLDSYCYYVAGVVGEMLTTLFCDHSPEIAGRREALEGLAASFGQSLQLTNILKDQREDRENGVCWLPCDLFAQYGIDLSTLQPDVRNSGYQSALSELIAITHAHLRNALRYILLIPSSEPGIRRFCFWTVNLAGLTLRNIYRKPYFADTAEIRVPSRRLKRMLALSYLGCRSNLLLTTMFNFSTKELPLAKMAVALLVFLSFQISGFFGLNI